MEKYPPTRINRQNKKPNNNNKKTRTRFCTHPHPHQGSNIVAKQQLYTSTSSFLSKCLSIPLTCLLCRIWGNFFHSEHYPMGLNQVGKKACNFFATYGSQVLAQLGARPRWFPALRVPKVNCFCKTFSGGF